MLPSKITTHVKETNKQIITQTLGFISSAFVLVAALAWNDAIRELISSYFPSSSGLISRFIYALIVTGIAVIVTMRLSALGEKLKSGETTQE